jgi:hypothetical protein
MDMINKPKIIKNNEKSLGTLSSVQLDFPDDSIYKFIDNRKFEVVWSKGFASISNGKITFSKKIYKSKQGFYLYLLMNNSETNFVIYYKQNQHSELTIFLQQLLKQYNNDKATNK